MVEPEEKHASDRPEATAMDVEFIPYVLLHKVHRNLKSSQVEILPIPHYFREMTPESEPEPEPEPEPDIPPPTVVFAPPLPALKEKQNWWDFVRSVYAFNNPLIRSRLEKLMSSQIVHVTDRKYMIKLQEKIKENHIKNLKKRIQNREADEIEREKLLLLEGKINLDDAPNELKNHPVCKINQLANKVMEEKFLKSQPQDRTHAYRTPLKRIRAAIRAKKDFIFEKDLEDEDGTQSSAALCIVDAEVSEDVTRGLMFSEEEYSFMKYEHPLVTDLRLTEAVDDMYILADQIIGSSKLTAVRK